MKLVYVFTSIELARMLMNSKLLKMLWNKIDFSNRDEPIEELSVRIWELEQLIYQLYELQGGKNEKNDLRN